MGHGRLSRSYPASVAVAAAVTLAASLIVYCLQVPNPVIVLVVVMIFFTAAVNNAAGATSGVCIILYALFFFSQDHSFVHFTGEGAYKCCVIAASLLAIYLMVATMRSHRDDAFRRLAELNERLEDQNEVLQHQSDHDELTGVYNRRGGDKMIARFIKEHGEGSFRAVLATMDIDNFKTINDVYGHAAGDQALKHLVRCLEDEFSDEGTIIRNGGDEFLLFLYGREYVEIQAQIREFCRRTFAFAYRGHDISFHISCGYAIYPLQASTEMELYRKADLALYSVKATGKHRALGYNGGMDETMLGDQRLSMRSVSENLPVSFMVYRADETEKILAASNSLVVLCGCRSFGEFMRYTGGTFRGFVHPDDAQRVELGIWRQVRASQCEMDAVDYRVRTRGGDILRIRDIGRLVHDENLGDLFYVALYDRDALSPEDGDA